MHAEVTSSNTLTSREEGRRLCQPQKHFLICRSSKEMDEPVPLSLQVQLRNMHNKTIIGFRMINYQGLSVCYPPQPSASACNTNFGLDNYRYHAQPHPIIVNYFPLTCNSYAAHYCYCAYVLRIFRYPGFLSVVLTYAGIFFLGLKLCGEIRT